MFTTRTHRSIIAFGLACALLASAMTGTSAARPVDLRAAAETSSLAGTPEPRQDLRSPDARDAARLPAPQDLRSPDARDASRANEIELAMERYYSTNAVPDPPAETVPAVPADETPWAAIGISIAATLAVVAISATGVRRFRVRRRVAA